MKTSIKDLNLLKWALPFSQLHFLAPVSILIFLSKGFSLEEITIAFTTLIFALYIVFEVPSGFFADKYGRKTSLVLAQILSICSLLLFIFAPSFEWLLIGSVIGGLSGSLFSGADSAILYDTSLVLGKEKEYEDILGVAKKREYNQKI